MIEAETSKGSACSSRKPPAARSISSPAMLMRAMSRSCSRWPLDSRACSSPVSASTRYAVKAQEEQGERVHEAHGRVGAQVLAVEGTVGQRELEVLGDEAGIERLAVGARATVDDPEGLDARHGQAPQVAQHRVLAVGDVVLDLLDGKHARTEAYEAHDMARDAAGEGGEVAL